MKLLIPVLAALLLSGCFGIEANMAANEVDNDATLRFCLYQNGIDPDAMTACMRDAQSPEQLVTCIPDEKKSIGKACYLAEQARIQETTHTITCTPGIFAGETCTEN